MNLYELRDALTHLGKSYFMFTQSPGIFAATTTFCPELRVQFYPNGKSRGSVRGRTSLPESLTRK